MSYLEWALASDDEFAAHQALLTGGERGATTRSCFEHRHEACRGITGDTQSRCNCLCHRKLDLDIQAPSRA